jgi:hypothetical protein
MANIFTHSTSAVSFPQAEYQDRYISVNQAKSTLEQGFTVNKIDALSGAKDSSINNYSSYYLTKRDKLTNFISLSSLEEEQSTSLVTRLGFERPDGAPAEYFYIFDSNTSATNQQKSLSIQPLKKTGFFENNYFFEIEGLNNNLCRIKHNNGQFDFYLNYNTDHNQFVFYQNSDEYKDINTEQADVFRYIIDDDGYMQLYKFYNSKLQVVSLSGGQLTIQPFLSGDLNRGINNLIHIDYSLDQNKEFINKSFASYNSFKTTNLIIDGANSNTDEDGQYMLVANYNTITPDSFPVNYFTLDTNRSEFNFVKRGSSMIDSKVGLGGDPREYYNIESGGDQEKGLNKINLNYSFYDKDVFVTNGSDTLFTTPSSIYPYEKLNVNDSQFVFNGAFAGPTPKLSDRVSVKRKNTTQYDNGRYLCTWLSGSSLEEQGIWVDRYYYPDKIAKEAALSATTYFSPSFIDSVDSIDLDVTDLVLNKEKFFDKKSDTCITPNSRVKYERIGDADIREIVESSTPLVSSFDSYTQSKIVRGETENFCVDYINDEITFDGTNFVCFNVSKEVDKTKNFTTSFNMYLDPNRKYGFALLGNNTNRGFGVFQDQTVTPFIHVVSENVLYIYNTDFTLRNKVGFKTKIKNVFKRSALDDYVVTTAGNLFYKVNSQGNKIKLECGSEILDYYGFYETHDHIDFISSDQKVRRFDLDTFDVTDVTAEEFDVYENEFCLYDNVLEYNDNNYKLVGKNKNWENDSTVFYQVSSYIVKHDLDGAPEAFLNGDVKDFVVVEDKIYTIKSDQYYVHNTSGVFQLSGSIENVTIPTQVSNFTTLSGGQFLSVDWVNEYVNGEQVTYPVFLAEGPDSNLYGVKGTSFLQDSLQATFIEGNLASNTAGKKLTNYNTLTHNYDASSIDFKLTLRNYLNTEDVLSQNISFDPTTFEAGFYNFTYRLDTKQGNASLYVNGVLYENQTFAPGKYLIQDIFSDEFFIGSAGFQSNMDLSTYLKQPGHYYCKDLTISNPFIYNEAISTEMVYALYLLTKKVDDIVLSIPAGQRTSKTEIQQFFKFNRTNSSNNINIVVRNLKITDEVVREQIKTSILAEANSFAPVGVKINDVVFKTY